MNECARRPCLNNGICMDLLNDFQCSCRPGYSGKQCEININSCAEACKSNLDELWLTIMVFSDAYIDFLYFDFGNRVDEFVS